MTITSPLSSLSDLDARVVNCRACPRLVAWREEVADVKRAAFRHEEYWARPLPGFGDEHASIVIVGLAPSAHGGNRTGRMFTGDRSGDFLYEGLHRVGLANQSTSVRRDDGLEVRRVRITAPVRCAPPANKPLPEELGRCSSWFRAELDLLQGRRVTLALGKIGHDAFLRFLGLAPSKFAFGHGAEHSLPDGTTLLDSYHVSQQNTQTGRLTPAMFDAVLRRAVELAS
ncbi:uracil-DNA glycosylase [Deinococcus yavapaiensis]|uniref:Type-5 uracil-DNA glycosylase n=1 Tax=Deinococcus yavapaiensis KR-236 TaxID=694435 RepID=A0A318SP27_9DEIO|nr:uracil-DNA glycosylase [Deinococcus yavapaiensis]PYE54500.1 uracil-DNA glycosylase family 4 [Deinococcus yavapaiensis KR-236]